MAKEDYYKECRDKGIDYAFYGDWQKQYAKLVIFMTKMYMFDSHDKVILDVGCACGSHLKGFKETGIFDKFHGVDVSSYLIELGREKLELSEDELTVARSSAMPFNDNSIDLIHCSQLFTYLEEEEILDTLAEMKRVLAKDGRIFLVFDKPKEGKEKKPTDKKLTNWKIEFKKYFKLVEQEAIQELFSKGKFYPGDAKDTDKKNRRRTFYDHYNNDWAVFILKGR
jgi:ubiquinone/menaquinone biosynthesis C-methylase UbiE